MGKYIKTEFFKNLTGEDINKMTKNEIKDILKTQSRYANRRVDTAIENYRSRGIEAPSWLSIDRTGRDKYMSWGDKPWIPNDNDSIQVLRNKLKQMSIFYKSGRVTYQQNARNFEKLVNKISEKVGGEVKANFANSKEFFKIYSRLQHHINPLTAASVYDLKAEKGSWQLMRMIEDAMESYEGRTIDVDKILNKIIADFNKYQKSKGASSVKDDNQSSPGFRNRRRHPIKK